MFVIRIRAIVGIMMFLGYFLMYVVRYNLSVYVLDMTQIVKRETVLHLENGTEITFTRLTSNRPHARVGDILSLITVDVWKIAILFSGYHIGYVICFPIFHNWGDRLGPTWVVGISGSISGTLNCLTPAAAYKDLWILFVVRILKGFCAGAMQPSMIQLLRHWVPPTERNHFMWAYCGTTMGTFSTFLLCSLIQYCTSWSIGFYITGIVQILWAIAWFVFVTDYPSKHPFISRAELEYLNSTIVNIFTIKLTNAQAPWKEILRSLPFWALCNLNFGYAWLIIALCLHGPLYYSTVVDYNIYSASALTALPFLLRLILGTIVIQLFHWYRQTAESKKVKALRTYFIVISHILPGLLLSSFWMTSLIPGPILLTLAVMLTAASMDITLDLCYELSPTFANSLNTVIKIIGNIPGIIVSFAVGAITKKYHNSPFVWKHIWCFHATMLLLSGIIFLIWGESSVQPWNSVQKSFRPHAVRIQPKHSIMSNILEVEEDDASTKMPFKNSALLKPFKILQSRTSN